MSMKTSEVLNKAADLIEEHGWEQGGTRNGVGETYYVHAGYCVEGAIAAANGASQYFMGYRCEAYDAVKNYLNQLPWTWNDAIARTEQEVIEVLRAAALIEQAKENQSVEQTVAA